MDDLLKIQIDDDGNVIDLHNDKSMRTTYCEVLTKIYGGTYISVKNKYDIDMYCLETKEFWEGEYGQSWEKDRGKNLRHRDRFNVGYYSINASGRKIPTITGRELENYPEYDFKVKLHKGKIINFIRGNKDDTQIFIVRHEILRDPTKYKIVHPDYAVDNATRPEAWMCIPAIYAEIYNLKLDGRYILSTLPGGEYMTDEEHEEYHRRLKMHAALVYQQSKNKKK